MSDKVLIVDYDPFNMESRIAYMCASEKQDTYRVTSSIPELVEQIIGLANKLQVYNVRVNGPLAIMSEIKSKVAECEMTLFSENKITVEGL